jgi:hypothetical protein
MTGRFRHKRPVMTVLFCRWGFLQLRKDLIHVEAGRLLPLRVVLKRHQELAHVSLCWHKLEGVTSGVSMFLQSNNRASMAG